MEPKKNPAYDVHQYRPALLGGSLLVSLLITIILFEWSVKKLDHSPTEGEPLFSGLVLEPSIHNFSVELPKQAKRVNPEKLVEVKEQPVVDDRELVLKQEPESNQEGIEALPFIEPLPDEYVPEDTFRLAEFMPSPEGGLEGFQKLLRKNLKYPAKAKRNDTQGKVFVEFTVSRTGNITNLKILKGIGDGCDQEASRVIALSKWKPGKQRGVPVNVRMVQAIDFRLNL